MRRIDQLADLMLAEMRLEKACRYLRQTGAHFDGPHGFVFHDNDRFQAFLIIQTRLRAVLALAAELRGSAA